jgi:CRISPR system Cascade subunit CasE
MPYLSRIWLNPLRTGTQALLRSPERMHAAVLGGIARQPVDERVLWRLDTPTQRADPRDHRAELLVLTDSRPSWDHVIEQAGWTNADDPQAVVRDYQPLLDRIQTGREFGFRLRANPVTATRNPASPSAAQKERLTAERPRGVRVPHRTAAHQLEWLTDRVASWGFTLLTSHDEQAGDIPAVRLSARERLVFFKNARETEKARRVVLSTATFDGALRVTDPDTARRALLSGVGAAKAYGCGLLTLAPLTAGGR